MFNLLLSIIASSMISIVMRLSQDHIKGEISMLAGNYLACCVLAVFFIGTHNLVPMQDKISLTLSVGFINGIFYVVSLILSQYCIKKIGVVLPSVFSRIGSLLVPLFMAIFFFKEMPNGFQMIGSLIAMGAIIAINYEKGSVTTFAMIPLFLLFSIDGLSSAMSKVYGEVGNPILSDHFLLYTFFSALVLAVAIALYRKEKPGIKELLFGICIGVPNFFSSRFLLLALNSIPAIVAYPIRSVSSIVLVALFGLLIFKEKLSRKQWFAFGAILVSIALLNL